MKQRSSDYKNSSEEYDYLINRFDLNNRYNHDNDNRAEKFQREYAKTKKEYLERHIDEMDSDFYKKAEKYADKKILEKYGDSGLSDLKHYQSVNSTAAVGAALALFGSLRISSKLL